MADTTVVYTDGACQGNPGPGGWAWAVPGGRWAAGAETPSTNQRMEVRAALEALRTLPGRVEVVSDSTYVVNCFRDEWWKGWQTRGWKNKAKQPVANQDLWRPLIDLYLARGGAAEVTFRWVKGHSADEMNDLVDRLAVAAAASQQDASGEEPPTELGPADSVPFRRAVAGPAASAAASAAPNGQVLPPGHLLVVTGHRPPGLGGYDENPVAAGVRQQLTTVLAAKKQVDTDLVVLTGLGLGAEQLGAEAAAAAGIPYVAVLPFPGHDAVWPAASRLRYQSLAAGAVGTLVFQKTAPRTKPLAAMAIAKRDAWLARIAAEAIVVWDGDDDAVGRLVRSFEQHLGEENVWIVTP